MLHQAARPRLVERGEEGVAAGDLAALLAGPGDLAVAAFLPRVGLVMRSVVLGVLAAVIGVAAAALALAARGVCGRSFKKGWRCAGRLAHFLKPNNQIFECMHDAGACHIVGFLVVDICPTLTFGELASPSSVVAMGLCCLVLLLTTLPPCKCLKSSGRPAPGAPVC